MNIPALTRDSSSVKDQLFDWERKDVGAVLQETHTGQMNLPHSFASRDF